MANGFRYKAADVIPDIRHYLLSLVSEDTYGTSTIKTSLHLVGKLVDNVSMALHDASLRDELLKYQLPDRVRILLEGVDLLPDREITRRWDMLRDIYRDFAATEAAARECVAGSSVGPFEGTLDDDIY